MRAFLVASACALALNTGARAEEPNYFAAPALSDQELAAQAGRQGVSIASMASVETAFSGNAVHGPSATGANSVGTGAFADLSGVASVLMNSGNNVVMNSVTIVNVALH